LKQKVNIILKRQLTNKLKNAPTKAKKLCECLCTATNCKLRLKEARFAVDFGVARSRTNLQLQAEWGGGALKALKRCLILNVGFLIKM
jgi:hypothetical protein